MSEKPKHSPIGASSRYRWSKCPGSVALSQGEPNEPGPAALEGTLAHEFCAHLLEKSFSKNVSPDQYLVEYLKHVAIYLDYVWELKQKCDLLHIEHGFDMDKIFPMLYGTADCVGLDKKNSTLHVVDYKHGLNLVVEVENNLQLEYYALGALTTLGYNVAWVQMTIVQPRAYHPNGPIRHWRVPVTHFLEVEESIVEAAKATKKKNARLEAGGHCMFCPAKRKCPERANANVRDAKKDFSFYNDPKKDFAPV